MTYTIKMTDGTEFTGLEHLGFLCFRRLEELHKEDFAEDRLKGLRIEYAAGDGEDTAKPENGPDGEYARVEFLGITKDPFDNYYYLNLGEPEPPTKLEELEGNMLYVAMMTGVEL